MLRLKWMLAGVLSAGLAVGEAERRRVRAAGAGEREAAGEEGAMNGLTIVLVVVAASSLLLEAAAVQLPLPVLQEVQAVVGRPLTPVSYAGVARRTTRRAVGAGAYSPYPVW